MSCSKVQPFHHPVTQNRESLEKNDKEQVIYDTIYIISVNYRDVLKLIVRLTPYHTIRLCWMGFPRFPVKCSVYPGLSLHGWVFSQGCVTLCMTPALIQGSEK